MMGASKVSLYIYCVLQLTTQFSTDLQIDSASINFHISASHE